MPNFQVTLVGIDSPYKEVVDVSIPDDVWHRLQSFKLEVDKLRSTRFVQNERGGQISIHLSEGTLLNRRLKQ